jgi:hypothetical protein
MAAVRLDSHTKEDVRKWFKEYHDTCAKYKIQTGKQVLNIDESSTRLGCPGGKEVIVLIDVDEMHTESPENRKSVTIIKTVYADRREPPPPFIVAPGKKIMENWLEDELKGDERIACTPTGYTNNEIALEYIDHLIKHTRAGPDKPWKILLLDGHESHHTEEFKIRAQENHILPFYFLSHLTYILQPLDVGIFRPWKHYHELAVQTALRSLDFDYSITSFFRDLPKIRSQTMQKHTIVNAFEDSGMWPGSEKAGIKRIRQFRQRRKKDQDKADDEDSTLPAHPPARAQEIGILRLLYVLCKVEILLIILLLLSGSWLLLLKMLMFYFRSLT